MRAFSFQNRQAGRILVDRLLPALLAGLLAPAGAAAQWPGVIEGRVVDAFTGRPVAGAAVSVVSSASPPGPPAATDGAGRFLLRGLDPGSHTVLVRHPGYAPLRRGVEVEGGRTAALLVEMEPVALTVKGVEVRVAPGAPGAVRIEPPDHAAGTVGDLLRSAPGVVVRQRGEGGRQTLSVRGGSPAEVLVLVDGVPLNDPVTGEADLSLVSASSVEGIVVLPGARSAAWGGRAQTGVVLIETRAAGRGLRLRAVAGSLGRLEGGVEAGARGGAVTALRETVQNRFGYRPPLGEGAVETVRRNADVERTAATASLLTPAIGGELRLRLRGELLERGLPGRSFAPSPHARQEDRRAQLAVGWERVDRGLPLTLHAHGAMVRSRLADPAPPAGLPYHAVTRVWTVGVRTAAGPVDVRGLGLSVGVDVEVQDVRAGSLAGPPPRRLDVGVRAEVARELRPAGVPVAVRLAGRLDRADPGSGLVASHEVTASTSPLPGLTVHAAHRSGFSPPSLADRYFRTGVGVEANPDLRAERTPSELEAGASLTDRVGPVFLSVTAVAYRGDVRDMIVWAPDFRFVWSPRNVDVTRRGGEVRGAARMAVGPGAASLEGSWSRARVTYDREPRGVQVRYRPRHAAALSASWESPRVRVGADARYTGTRYPVPAPVNALPGFWSFDLEAGGRLTAGDWTVEPTLRVDRLFDARDAMIFGFPEPGRTVSLSVTVGLPRASEGGVDP